MSEQAQSPWIVLKFGGTSVSSVANWRNIAEVVKRRRAEGASVIIVHSAVSGITDRLEKLLTAALAGEHEGAMAAIEARHLQLCDELGIGTSAQLQGYFTELRQISQGISLMREISDRTRARVMSNGELMATEIGSRFLRLLGIDAAWWDAREGLKAEERSGATTRGSLLSATCNFAPDPALSDRLLALSHVVITQGFIASDAAGDTVLLGRGGSDTSGAYFAAKLQARRLEIWTDVPGMFSANPRSTPSSRLLRELHYDEAQEIASSGAKVLHPRCILPVRAYNIPLYVYATQKPDLEGTRLSADPGDSSAKVKAVCVKKGITLVTLLGTASIFAAAGQPGRSQHPRDPAQAGRGLRVLRRAAHLFGEPGRQRPELHLCRGRRPGRSPGQPAARTADPARARRSRPGPYLGAAVRQAAGQAAAPRAVVAGRIGRAHQRTGFARHRLRVQQRNDP